MNPDTKAIAHFETEEDAWMAGYTIPLSPEMAAKLQALPRTVRDQFLAESREKPRVELTAAQRAAKKNERKRQRRARREGRRS